jgi:AbrB family looped-hinge helix DNA binding protein
MKSKKSSNSNHVMMDMVTINDKGQIVIPYEARAKLSLSGGDKLLVMLHPSKESIILMKPDGIEKFATDILNHLSIARNKSV